MEKRKKKAKRKKTSSLAMSKKKDKEPSEAGKIKKIKVRLIGIGGGGGSIVSEIAQRVKGASFFAANSDLKALNRVSRKVTKFHFGDELTHGLGTGMNPGIGQEAAKSEKERIKNILEGQDFVILISCLGGGLGSGAAPIFAKISKDLGNLTYGIFTLPFKFEGTKKMEIARDFLDESKRKLNAISIIPNERIFQIIERTAPLNKALSVINRILADSLQSLIEIIYKPGLINIDFADLSTIFEGRGRLTYLNSIEIGKEEDEKEAIERVISSPLYPYSINGARGVLFNIAGRKDLSLSQVNHISRNIADKAYQNAKVIFGISGATKGSRVRVTLLATGCNKKNLFGKKKKKSSDKKPQKIAKSKKKKEGEPENTKVEVVKPKSVKPKKTRQKRKPKKKKKIVKPVTVLIKPKRKKTKEKKRAKRIKIKVRKNAIQVKKDIEQEEAEIISKEKVWDTPSFLRKKAI
jgi:cell division protein FtsZ